MLDYKTATVIKMGNNAPSWDEMEAWLVEHCEGDMEIMPIENFGARAYFENEQDAAMFALRWLRD